MFNSGLPCDPLVFALVEPEEGYPFFGSSFKLSQRFLYLLRVHSFNAHVHHQLQNRGGLFVSVSGLFLSLLDLPARLVLSFQTAGSKVILNYWCFGFVVEGLSLWFLYRVQGSHPTSKPSKPQLDRVP